MCIRDRIEDMEPGESRTVTVHVDERSLSYWYTDAELTQREDGTKDKWTVAEGTRKIYVGAASDLSLIHIFGAQIMPSSYEPVTIFILAPGAFLVLSMLTAAQNKIKMKAAQKGKETKIGSGCTGTCSSCSSCPSGKKTS